MARDDSWIEELGMDHHSGAAEIVARVAEELKKTCGSWIDDGSRLADIGLRCIAGQPSMAPLVNLFNDLLWIVESYQSIAYTVENVFEKYIASGDDAALPEDCCPFGSVVLCHSYSSSVLNVLLGSKERIERVICLESRPLFEGRTLAQRLAEGGVPVIVTVDAAMAEMLERVDVVAIGVDCIHPSGLINKQGTRALTGLAALMGKRTVAIGSKTKILGAKATERFIKIMDQDPGEVWSSPVNGVTVENRYFDTTPLDSISLFFLDGQSLNRRDIHEQLNSYRLHPRLNPAK